MDGAMKQQEPPLLTLHDGEGAGYRSGEDFLDEVFDLIRCRLPELHPSDPVRVALSRLAPYRKWEVI